MEKTVIEAVNVREVIGRHMLADGLDIVVDLERSRGSRLFDSQSQSFFIDFFGFFATNALGMNHPGLNNPDAIRELGTVAVHKPSNSDIYTREMAEFVDAFSRIAMPDSMKYMFFIEGGALAVENALKAAFDWKVRKNLARGVGEKGYQVIHFREAFHGRSGYTLSMTNTSDPRKTDYFPMFDWPRIDNPKCIYPLEGDNLARVEAAEAEAVRQIQAAIEQNPDDIACILLEPIQSEGGDNHFRPEFHSRLRQICDDNEILLIHDEVQTGFGITGKFWCSEHFVQPDMIAFGKKSQVCGFMAGPRLDEVADNVFRVSSRINSTWGGNLVDMVRSRLQMMIYEEEGIVEQAATKGRVLLAELQSLQQEFPHKVSNVRGMGLLCAIDIPTPEERRRIMQEAFGRNLILLSCGVSSIRFRPALTIPEEDLLEGLGILREVISE